MFAEKVFSFLSKDEVEKLKQEEERKIATLQRDKKHNKMRRNEDDEDEDEDENDGEEHEFGNDDDGENGADDIGDSKDAR